MSKSNEVAAMRLALELFEQFGRDSRLKYEHQAIYKTIVALKEALAKQEGQSNFCAQCEALSRELKAIKQEQSTECVSVSVGEPVTFEEWLSKQHGDPEEIGFLQALRIAYISGQDSITTPQPAERKRKPLTDEQINSMIDDSIGPVTYLTFARAIEAAHGITEENT